jgi:hypothetical protein
VETIRVRNQARIAELLSLSETRKTNSVCIRSNLDVFRELEIQRSYIQRTLLHLEKKILAESIVKVSHAKKNQRVEIWLGKPSIKVDLRLDDLLKMDALRENSLFKVSKTSMKCQTPYCSYNVLSPAL